MAMKSGKTKLPWIEKTIATHKDDWKLSVKIVQNGHVKVLFYDEADKKWTFVTGNTPSDRKVRRNEISTIKKNFKEKFNIEISDNDFTMQMYRGGINN